MTFNLLPTLLVTDDDPIVRKMIRFSLRSMQVLILEASSGKDAISMLERQIPELIILDYDLGDITASRFLELLSLQGIRIPKIILLTSYEEEFITSQNLNDQVSRVITKPFSPKELLLLVKELLS